MTIPASETAEPREIALLVPPHIDEGGLREPTRLLTGMGVEIVAVNSAESQSGTVEKVDNGLRLSRDWFISDESRKKHQEILKSAGLIRPVVEKSDTGLKGVRYLVSMIADLVIANGWSRESGDPMSIFEDIHMISDNEEEPYATLSDVRKIRAQEQAQRWGISCFVGANEVGDLRIEAVRIDKLDVFIADLENDRTVRFGGYQTRMFKSTRNQIIQLLRHEQPEQPVET